MDYIFTFLVYLIEILQKRYKGLFIEAMSSSERTMLVAERFIAWLINKFGKCPVSTDGGTWYPQACKFLDVEHHIHIHSSFEKDIFCFVA
jgi:transposase-like protein